LCEGVCEREGRWSDGDPNCVELTCGRRVCSNEALRSMEGRGGCMTAAIVLRVSAVMVSASIEYDRGHGEGRGLTLNNIQGVHTTRSKEL
jgi:hypothetical protein